MNRMATSAFWADRTNSWLKTLPVRSVISVVLWKKKECGHIQTQRGEFTILVGVLDNKPSLLTSTEHQTISIDDEPVRMWMLELRLLHDIVIHRIFQQEKNYKAVDGSRSPEPMNVTFRSFNRGTQKWGQRNGKKLLLGFRWRPVIRHTTNINWKKDWRGTTSITRSVNAWSPI